MKYIIVDLRTNKALYGIDGKTFIFSTIEGALDFRKYMFQDHSEGLIIEIKE